MSGNDLHSVSLYSCLKIRKIVKSLSRISGDIEPTFLAASIFLMSSTLRFLDWSGFSTASYLLAGLVAMIALEGV